MHEFPHMGSKRPVWQLRCFLHLQGVYGTQMVASYLPQGLKFPPLLLYILSLEVKGSNVSFLLPGPIPFSDIAFQIGHTTPLLLPLCWLLAYFWRLSESSLRRSPWRTHSSGFIVTCSTELWFLLGKGKNMPFQGKVVKKSFKIPWLGRACQFREY